MKVATTTVDAFVAPTMLPELMERARDIEMLDPPARNPVHVYLIDILLAQCEALRTLQDSSGYWHILLDRPGSFVKVSATAGFAYGILKVVWKWYIPSGSKGVGERRLAPSWMLWMTTTSSGLPALGRNG